MQLSEIDLCDLNVFARGVPYEAFALLRATAPVYWHPETTGAGFWAVTKYRDVVACSREPRTYSSGRKGCFFFDPPPEDLATMQLMLVNMDPPKHTKLRSLVNKGFTPRMIARLEPRLRDVTNSIIDVVAAKGYCDFVTEIAAELPLQAIAELMGIPREDRHMVFDWSNRLIGFDDPEYNPNAGDNKIAAFEMYTYANQLARKRRDQPGDDLVSVLMDAEVDGDKLSELEFDLFFLLLAVAGNETTRNLISGGMLALIENPAERARLLNSPSLIPTAVEEMLRWVSPVIEFRRTVTRDTELSGQKLREGDKVILYYISANRDEDVFSRPHVFNVGRTPNDHVAFGIGEHFCLGSSLARLEIRIMFEELLRRLPDIELAGPVERLRSTLINGIKRMPVAFSPERRRQTAGAAGV